MSAASEDSLALVRSAPSYSESLIQLAEAHSELGYLLLRDYPALAILVVRHFNPLSHGERSAYLRTMLLLPWKTLLRQLDLPVRPRTRRILGLLPIEHCHKSTVEKLCVLLRSHGHKWIHAIPHLPKLTRDAVSLLLLDSQCISGHLLRASADSEPDVETVTWLVTHIRHLLLEQGRDDWPFNCSTFEGLKIAEGRLYQRGYVDCCLPFPAPPIPGKAGVIHPICDYGALFDEGANQDNCSATLVGDVISESVYVYAVYAPERASLALRRDADTGLWDVMDLRCTGNTETSDETKIVVQQWITSFRNSSGNDRKQ